MTQILGDLSKNSFKRKIKQTRPSAQCPLLPSVQSSHLFTHQSSPSLSICTSTLSTCSLRPSALSVRPSVCQLCPFHPSTLYCPFLLCSPFVPPSICLSVHPLCPSIQTVQLVRRFSPSICSSVRQFVHPVCLSVQSVCPSTLRMATRTAKNQYVKISKTAVLQVHRTFCTFLCRSGTNST